VATGLVTSLSRPGGNVTGVTSASGQLVAKELQLLHELLPAATKVAVLVNPNNPVASQESIQYAQAAAPQLGLEITVVNAGSESEIEAAFATVRRQQAAAIMVSQEAFLSSRRDQIAELTLRNMMPTISSEPDNAAAGALISYGAILADTYRQGGIYVGRILKGEKPSDLPVIQPTKFELVINIKTAKALGLTIPPTLLAIADEVIE
jgi:putative ABC transport system substrate-binding protein